MKTSVRDSSKGQISIPAGVRKQLGIQPGDELALAVHDGELTLKKPLTMDELSTLVSSWIPDDVEPVLDADAYYQEHRSDRV